MVRVLTNREMEGLLSVEEAIPAVEDAFRELGEGTAAVIPRRRIYLPLDGEDRRHRFPVTEGTYYWHNNIPGALPGQGVMALRLDSVYTRVFQENGLLRADYPGKLVGMVLLFDLKSCDLLAILHDHALSTVRVAATSAVGAKKLAREDARVLGLFGSSEQAFTQVQAMCNVRPLERVKVYSPNAEHRRRFIERVQPLVKAQVVEAASPEETVRKSDIVVAATNSRSPIFDGRWVEPGTHVVCIVGADLYLPGSEIDEETVRRADRIVANLTEQIRLDRQPKLLGPIEKGILKWEEIGDLADLVAGNIPGRQSAREITLHDNNCGMGIQFAAVGALVYRKACRLNLGRELPDDLFETRREGSFSP